MQEFKNQPGLYEQLCSKSLLYRAWRKVERKNKAGGIDRVSVRDFRKVAGREIEGLLSDLRNKAFTPEPYLEVLIPKNETEKRSLGLLTVRDKVLQQAILFLIADDLNRSFLPTSYAYRPQKGHLRAINRVWHTIRHEKKRFFLKEDVDNFFDTIPHDRLERKLRAAVPDPDLVNLILLQIRMGKVSKQLKWKDVRRGIPQGGLLSPVLANLYLHELDEYMTRFKDCAYIRYGILYGRVWDAVIRARLNPTLSFFHTPRRGMPSLTFDLIEEFRQRAVDSVVFALINRGEGLSLQDGFLSTDTRKRLAEKVLERLNSPENFRGTRMLLGDVIRQQSRNFARYVEGKIPSYKPYSLKW